MHRALLLIVIALAIGTAWFVLARTAGGDDLVQAPAGSPPHSDPEAGAADAALAPSHRREAGATAAATSQPASGPGTSAPAVRTGTVHVEVVADGGGPLPGCRVRSFTTEAEQVTDAQGRATLVLPLDGTSIDVQPPTAEHVPRQGPVTVVPDGEVTVLVVLRRTDELPFYGRVVTGTPAQPVAGARLELFTRRTRRATASSAVDGTFQFFTDRRQGWIEVTAAGFGPVVVAPEPGHETRASAFDVVLAPAAELTVSLVDQTRRPLAGKTVRIDGSPFDWTQPAGFWRGEFQRQWQVPSDADGNARFASLPAQARLHVHVPSGPAMRSVETLVLGPGAAARSYVLGGCTLSGSVRDAAGRGIADLGIAAFVAVDPRLRVLGHVPKDARRTRTDAAGRFRFEDLDPGTWSVGVAEGDAWTRPAASVELTAANGPEVELRVEPAAFVAGRAVLPGGAPAAGVVLDLLDLDGNYVLGGGTDGTGRFRLGPLPPGDYLLDSDEYEETHGLPQRLRVRAGTEDLVLRLEPVTGMVRGVVVDAAGRPQPAWVSLRHRERDAAVAAHNQLDGRFRHAGLRAGTWDATAHDDAGNVAFAGGIRVTAGREAAEVRFTLEPGATLLVRVPVSRGDFELHVERDGGSVFADNLTHELTRVEVPPGDWTVRLLDGGRERHRQRVTARAGREHEVVLAR